MNDPSPAAVRRGWVFGLTALSTVMATAELSRLLSVKGHTALEYLLLFFFALNFAWIALAFWTNLAGFAVMMQGVHQPGLRWPTAEERQQPLTARVAIVAPVYNESPIEVLSRLEAMARAVIALGHGQIFDFFILSDTQDPDVWVREELEWEALRKRLGDSVRVFYRRRAQNSYKKSGNIADFCRRWGSHYESFVVLDADSLMSGETLVTMARLMELNPEAGIIQVPPLLIGRQTLFARLQQFAASVYGRINAAGLAFWHLGDSNYWGHNAIIRSVAFLKYCGLPVLPGAKPFGGEILSHDFVEAAMIRRAGYSVWLVPELEGSYEQVPPTLLDYAKRDRRWCQGNMQHAPLVFSAGMHPMSRIHFALGVMSYAASPLWLGFLAVGLLAAVHDKFIEPSYFPAYRTLFPIWPTFETESAIRLSIISLALLLTPKLLGVAWVAFKAESSAPAHRKLLTLASALFEIAWSVLLAPVNMVLQSGFVASSLMGRSVNWGSQTRDDQSTSWKEAFIRHGGHTLFGVAVAALCLWAVPALIPWTATLAVGLLLSIPLSVLSSRPSWGRWLLGRGLLVTSDERHPPEIVREADRLTRERMDKEAATSESFDGLSRVLTDPHANALHLALLAQEGVRPPAASAVASGRQKVESGAFDALTRPERLALLTDSATLTDLHHAHLAKVV
jgi:membrane glycosyltransferase